MKKNVYKEILTNGLTVLVHPSTSIPKVSIQLWYNVGSKDEKNGQKGIAHLIEHMIFKGTSILSECDINLITHKLSGNCNAFTSYDYTGYLFNFPSQHWFEALPIMADCMRNCTFKEDFLSSELKAVIQELKMYKDDYLTSIIENLISAIFADHPYHYPIIGFKQDLWNLERNNLISFYKQHYIPNNATLCVVGDVEVNDVFKLVHKYFGNIAPNFNYKKEEFYHSMDLKNYTISMYRDVKQPIVVLAWVVPGATQKKDLIIEVISWLLASGKGSRLYKKLVIELNLVTELEMFNYDLFDYGVVFIYFQPEQEKNIEKIIEIINKEIDEVIEFGIKNNELMRAIKKTEFDHLSILEDNQKQAYSIGKYFLANKDEEYLYNYLKGPKENLSNEVIEFMKSYFRKSVMSEGRVLPINDNERKFWLSLQNISDKEDARILSGKVRNSPVEEGKCVFDVHIEPPKSFNFAKAQTLYLSNGLKVLTYNNKNLPKIDLILDFKAHYYYDSEKSQGLINLMASLLTEGTKNYNAQELADILESYGMNIDCYAGQITMSLLACDLIKALELLSEILINATFEESAIKRVKSQILADIDNFWDTPTSFIIQLAREKIYKDHPYSKLKIGSHKSIKSMDEQEIVDAYKKFITPKGAVLSIVGNLEQYEIKKVLEHMLSSWQGPEVQSLNFAEIKAIQPEIVKYPIMRDQIVLCYCGISVSRDSKDYDSLLLFDQIFTGGILGSMSSRLFDLREKSGLFYTIGGSLIYKVSQQPGMIMIKTIVSNDRLEEAMVAIEKTINTATDYITDSEFEEAQRAIVNSLVDLFATNEQIATSLLYQDKYNLPHDYYDKRAEQLYSITKEHMCEVVKKYLSSDKLIKIMAGRLE